jgi:MinD-like ATPase involved in chromosome partitioning or flagellar assembly
MTSMEPPGHTAVLLAAAGERWEAEALARLERRGSGTVLARRCVDLTDVLATASAGLASVAVLSATLPGLDADSVSRLRTSGVAVVAVLPVERAVGEGERLRRLGIENLLASSELVDLVDTVTAAGTAAPGASIRSTVAPEAGEDQSPSGRVLVVWGPAGAPGRTTVAVGLATEVARAGAGVLLVDVDPYGGTVAAHLGVLDEVSGLLAAARAANTGQLDRVRLAGLARQVGDDLRVLTGLPRPDRWQEVRPAAFAELLGEAARLAPWLVLDAGFSLESDPVPAFGGAGPQRNEMTVASLQRADEVVVVGAADPIGLARLARGLVELHELLPALRPRVVVNRTRTTLGWSDREIRGMVEGFVRPVDVHFLPEDRAAADRALMAGRSLAESGDSALRRAMSELAHEVLGRPAARTRRRGRGPGRGR